MSSVPKRSPPWALGTRKFVDSGTLEQWVWAEGTGRKTEGRDGGGVKGHYIHVWMYMYLLIHKVYVCVHVCVNEKGPPSYFLLVLNVILVRSQSPLWPWESPMSGVPAGFGRDLSGKELLGCLELQNWAGQKLPSTNGTQAFDKNFHLSLRKVSLIFFFKGF